MKTRFLALLLIAPMMLCCTKPQEQNDDSGQDPQKETPDNPSTPETVDEDLAPEITDGSTVLVTNETVEKFLTEVTYPERDYSTTSILDEKYGPTAPGKSDKPQDFTIRWKSDLAAGDPKARLWEDGGWSREYTTLSAEDYYLTITNLIPNTKYHYEVKAGDKVLTSGSFTTTGHVRQLYFYSQVRNVRDLGGWKTKDGKTVKYRKIYRGGRLQKSTLSSKGLKDIKAEGILAQLDLRGKNDVLTETALGDGVDFCAPVIEEGYTQLLKDDQDKVKQCFEFILGSVRNDKPVYFHCSLGRDRTGTMSMVILGILGVDEGEISKEYELTQFAPHGWATSDGEKVKMTRKVDYKGAAQYIWGFTDENGSFADAMQAYLLSIGISQAEIDEFRSLMLE